MIATVKLLAPWGEIHPVEREEIGFKSTFGTRPNVMQLSIDTVTLANVDREEVFKWIYTTNSRFEAIPISVQSDTGTFNYMLDINKSKFGNSMVTIPIVPFKGNTQFFEEADKLTFDAIEYFSGGILSANAIDVPYLIVKPTLALETAVLALNVYSLTTEIIRTVKAIADLAGQALDAVGTGALTTIAQAVALAIYLAGLIVSFISLINQLVKIFFPRLRYLKGMRDIDLVRLGCEYLGYTLDSTLLSSLQNYVTVPKPITRDSNRPSFFELLSDDLFNTYFNYGYPTANDTTPTLGSFISSIEQIFNAETIVYNGAVKIETRSWFQSNPVVQIDEYFNNQDIREREFSFDIEEDWKRKAMGWTIDYSDLHTADKFYKTSTERDTSVVTATNPSYVTISGFKDIPFQFSLAQRKNDLTVIEKTFKAVLNIADSVINLFGGNSNYSSLVTNRLGVMIISEEQFAITKKIYAVIENRIAKQPSNFIDFIGADYIYKTFHTDMEIKNNSGIIIENMAFPCSEHTFSKFTQNKFVNLGTSVVELLEASFKYNRAEAVITYKDYDNSGLNTQTIQIY